MRRDLYCTKNTTLHGITAGRKLLVSFRHGNLRFYPCFVSACLHNASLRGFQDLNIDSVQAVHVMWPWMERTFVWSDLGPDILLSTLLLSIVTLPSGLEIRFHVSVQRVHITVLCNLIIMLVCKRWGEAITYSEFNGSRHSKNFVWMISSCIQFGFVLPFLDAFFSRRSYILKFVFWLWTFGKRNTPPLWVRIWVICFSVCDKT
jgi:hypothetical protein